MGLNFGLKLLFPPPLVSAADSPAPPSQLGGGVVLFLLLLLIGLITWGCIWIWLRFKKKNAHTLPKEDQSRPNNFCKHNANKKY